MLGRISKLALRLPMRCASVLYAIMGTFSPDSHNLTGSATTEFILEFCRKQRDATLLPLGKTSLKQKPYWLLASLL
eukprot:5812394-Karenia_brevis.AAC.1